MNENQSSAVKDRFMSLTPAQRLIAIGSITLTLLCLLMIVFLAIYFGTQGSTTSGNKVGNAVTSSAGQSASSTGDTLLENTVPTSSENTDQNISNSSIGSNVESSIVSSGESVSSASGNAGTTNQISSNGSNGNTAPTSSNGSTGSTAQTSSNGSTGSTAQTSSNGSISTPPLLVEGVTASVNVRQYGAVGDGVADDTAAFRTALSVAKDKQLPVYVPDGTYRLTSCIELTSQTITGYSVTNWPAEQNKLPTLLLDHTNAGFVTSNAAISGVHITYKNASGSKPAIEVKATGSYISNVKITNAPSGIIFWEEGSYGNPGRSNVENVIMEGINNIGLYLTGTMDVPYVNNVSVSGTSANFKNSGIAFKFGQNDDARVINCVAKGAYIGYELGDIENLNSSTVTRSTWGSLIDCTAEDVSIGIHVTSHYPTIMMHPVTLNRMTIKAKTNAVKVDSSRMQMTIADSQLISSGTAILLNGGDGLTFFKCKIQSGGSSEAVRIQKTGSAIISNCQITSGGKGIVIDNAAHTGLVIVNNTITASGTKIEDNSSSGIVKTIAGNS